jgi:FkbM family methyltransferase
LDGLDISAASTLLALRSRALWRQAQIDALQLAAAAARSLLPSGPERDRIHRALTSRQAVPTHRMAPFLRTFADSASEVSFLQIGASTGAFRDPIADAIRDRGWSGVIVEPIPHVAEDLRRAHAGSPGVIVEAAAVGPEDGDCLFYHLDAPVQPDPRAERSVTPGSVRREVVLFHRRSIFDIDDRLVESRVPCLTFESLCRRHDLSHLDVLLIDTEGYDYEILRQIDLHRLHPTLVVYESATLPTGDKTSAAELLDGCGYETIQYGPDTWCFGRPAAHERNDGSLASVWRWTVGSYDPGQALPPTQMLRRLRHRLAPVPNDPALALVGSLSERDRRYLANGYNDDVPLPVGAGEYLSTDNPRLVELRDAYSRIEVPAAEHHMWSADRVSEHVDLRYFRGDNLYVWHRPEHPDAMSLRLFAHMRYLEGRGGEDLLGRLSEDGAFGCWTTDIPGYGLISRDLLDSVNELLFLERELEICSRPQLRILDVGSGYGRLAHRASSALANLTDYCCVDAVPESTFLAAYYLQHRECVPPARVVPLDRVETELEPGGFDLAVNVHSFSECTFAAIVWWLEELRRLKVPHLFVVPNEADGILSRESDGGYRDALPAFEAVGYRPTVIERAVTDPAVRKLARVNDNHYLFRLDVAHA